MSNGERPALVLKPLKKAGMVPRIVYSFVFILIFGVPSLLFTLNNPEVLSTPVVIIPAIMILFFIIIPIIFIFTTFMNLRAREYRFFGDRVEFYEGFINIRRSIVRYDRITDVSFSRSIWDRYFGTGTIRLNTAGSTWHAIDVSHITNSERIYEQVQGILKRYSGGGVGTEAHRRVRHR
ncbi:MAG: PH domain-containing protein [Candidatus Aenigmatarchaeota archaeon]|nr:MAG: PH domain-containing protein [Candidatus Aenigmarchaeota archaeon]